MRRFWVMLAAVIGLGVMMASVPAKAAPALSLLPDSAIQQLDNSQSLVTEVGHHKYKCVWKTKCKKIYTCWWKGGYKYCGWRTKCHKVCHKVWWKKSHGIYLKRPRVRVQLYY